MSQLGFLGPPVPSKSIWVPAAGWQLLPKFKHSWGHCWVPRHAGTSGTVQAFGWQQFSGSVLWWCKWGVHVTKFKETLTLKSPASTISASQHRVLNGFAWPSPSFLVSPTQSRNLPYPNFPPQQTSFDTLLDEGWEIITDSVKFKIRLCGIRDVLL